MHVGVFLDDIRPETGGGFTFVDDVVAAFLGCARESQHRFTLFCPRAYAKRLEGRLSANLRVRHLRLRGFWGRLIVELRHASPFFSIAWRRWCELERVARADGIEVMWFVGGTYDTLDMPYFTTVWDLQHRTHPWFPEVSSRGHWDHREVFFSRHLQRATCIITGTKVGQIQLEQFYGVPADRVRVLPHPTPAFAMRAGDALPSRAPRELDGDYFYYPAQFWAHKNHANLLRGYALLKASRPNSPSLVFSGSDKGNRVYIEQLAKELGLRNKVHFLGFVSWDEVVGLYRNARALVYPSFSGPENLPPLEAFALGCPVVASEIAGAREQLEDAAIYFDPTEPEAIRAALAAIQEDTALRDRLIVAGKARAARWTGRHFVRGVFAALDDFEPMRRSWPP